MTHEIKLNVYYQGNPFSKSKGPTLRILDLNVEFPAGGILSLSFITWSYYNYSSSRGDPKQYFVKLSVRLLPWGSFVFHKRNLIACASFASCEEVTYFFVSARRNHEVDVPQSVVLPLFSARLVFSYWPRGRLLLNPCRFIICFYFQNIVLEVWPSLQKAPSS